MYKLGTFFWRWSAFLQNSMIIRFWYSGQTFVYRMPAYSLATKGFIPTAGTLRVTKPRCICSQMSSANKYLNTLLMTRRLAARGTLNSIFNRYSIFAVEFTEYLLAQYAKANIAPFVWSHLRETIAESTAEMIGIQSKLSNQLHIIW